MKPIATLGPAYEERLAKAMEIVSHEQIEQIGETEWSVPSQSGFGRYRVRLEDGVYTCGCKDFEARAPEPCKHCLAVIQLAVPIPGPLPAPRKQYPQNWHAYDQGQTEEMRLVDVMLRDLVNSVPEIPRMQGIAGRPASPLCDQAYCAVLKVYSGMSGRRAHGVHLNVADRGLLAKVPSFMVASRFLNRPEMTPALRELLRLSAGPLAGLEEGGAISPDSTGVRTTQFGAWMGEKHGDKREHRWVKVHAIVGTKTHIVIDAIVDDSKSADCPQFEPLLRGALEAGFRPGTVPADKGYLSRDNYSLAASLGIEAFIPFKVNSVGQPKGSPAWRTAFPLFEAKREEWDANYHLRSNVESVFSAIKRKFGETIRSKNPVAQVNETYCKLIAYNLTVVVHEMFEHGIAPQFVKQNSAG